MRAVHLFHHHLLLVGLLLGVVLLLLVSRHSEIHQSFHSLFSLRSLRLHLVEGVVQNLPVVGEELAHLLEVDFNDGVLRQQLSNDMKDVGENSLEDSLVDLGALCHGCIIWLC